ncbi:MAG: Ig-like domain-containing protein [Candidatus Thermoplasmatota archaeon]|nr:Ig-like domain-containing protein [Candidatus Thermoplasmatota archaeon]
MTRPPAIKPLTVLCILLLSVAVHCLFVLPGSAQDDDSLTVALYDSEDWNEYIGTTVLEGKQYDIIASTADETIELNVTITVLGQTYFINETQPFITITAPLFDQTHSFLINATKEGYVPYTSEISVVQGFLSVVADRSIVEEKKEFQVTVTDHDGHPVADVTVTTSGNTEPAITDAQGVAYIDAPNVDNDVTISIQATKEGFLLGATTIRIDNVEGFLLDFTGVQFLQVLPILLAVLVVIIAIIIVLWRQKRSKYMAGVPPSSDTPAEPLPYTQRRSSNHATHDATLYSVDQKKDLSVSTPSSKVEELRIPVQEKKKETTYLTTDKHPEHPVQQQKTEPDEWFKGENYMRYKLDELTGQIDQQTDGKWFEGERDSKYKVDETLKKSAKKKKDDEEDDTK